MKENLNKSRLLQCIPQNEADRILREARDMLKGVYYYNGVWDMEPCRNPVSNPEIRWDVRYKGDCEWAFMFTRMDYLYKLCLATEISGDVVFARHGLRIIAIWWKDHNLRLRGGWAKITDRLFRKKTLADRTLDVSIMLSNSTDFFLYCADRKIISSAELDLYRKRAQRIIDYVFWQSDGDFKAFSNWGIQENGNIVYTLLRLGEKKHYQEAAGRLIRQIHNQIKTNGSQIESAPMYLVEILWVLLRILSLPNCDIREQLIPPVLAGCCYIINLRKPDNCIPNLGDSDITDISDLLTVAGCILKRNDFLQYASRPLDPEYIVKFARVLREHIVSSETDSAVKKETAPDLIDYPYQTVYRNGGTWLLCSNTPKSLDGHKHSDYLSVMYSEWGRDILVDLGRPSYKDDEERKFHKGPAAHNTVSVINKLYGTPVYWKYVSSWATDEQIGCMENVVLCETPWFSVRMSCTFGYGDIEINRYVTYRPGTGLLITDVRYDSVSMDSKADYLTESFFNLSPEYEWNGNSIRDTQHVIYYNNDCHIKPAVKQVVYSDRYNEREQATQLSVRARTKRLTHAFLLNDYAWSVKYFNREICYIIGNDRIVVPIQSKKYEV